MWLPSWARRLPCVKPKYEDKLFQRFGLAVKTWTMAKEGGQAIQRKHWRATRTTKTGAYNANTGVQRKAKVAHVRCLTTVSRNFIRNYVSRSRNLWFHYINNNFCATQTKNNWANNKENIFRFHCIHYVLIQHGVVCPCLRLYAPVRLCMPLYASVRPCTPLFAAVRPL